MLIDRVIVGPMYTNSYIISTGKKECIVVDPGADGKAITKRLEAMNLLPRALVYTHGHLDHTSGTQEILDHYIGRDHTDIVRLVHPEDAPFFGTEWKERNGELFATFGPKGTAAFEALSAPVPPPTGELEDGTTILNTDLEVLHVPGHTPGSIALYSEPREALFTGDLLFFNAIARTDFPGADGEQALRMVKERFFSLPPQTRVFPGHGPVSTIEREIQNNPLTSEGATV